MENAHFIKRLEMFENAWGIWVKVTEEWEKTFDKLLEYYNTKDLRSMCEAFCCNTKHAPKNKLISVKELGKWMKPQMEPPLWKSIFGTMVPTLKAQYEKQKKEYDEEYKLLMDTLIISDDLISKRDINRIIIKQLRKGNKKVIILGANDDLGSFFLLNHLLTFHYFLLYR